MESKNGVSEQQFTGLILVSGVDSPGITEALFETLAPFAVTILDIQQVVIRGRLILTVLISLSPAHAKSIETDLEDCATQLCVDIATAFESSDQKTIAPQESSAPRCCAFTVSKAASHKCHCCGDRPRRRKH